MRFEFDIDGANVSGAASAALEPTGEGALLRARTVRLDPPAGAAPRFYRHGWQSWSPTWWVDPTTRPAVCPVPVVRTVGDDPAYAEAPRHGGSALGALADDAGGVLLLGALELGGRVEVDRDGTLHGTFEDGAGVWFVTHGKERAAFARYASGLGERFGVHRQPTGGVWCSWYSFHRDITESALLEVMDGLVGLEVDVFQIDDGWQIDIGDWEPNRDFPAGIDGLAARARAAGYRPGLWMAPFIAHERSRVFKAHPEWFVRGADDLPLTAGVNWGGRFHGLDLTHPGARDHVARSIRAAVGWGCDYLKLDFLYAAALPGRRQNDVGREPAYRSGVELVRDVAGDHTYLLACGAPIVPSLGVFDGLRVGPDVAPWWENTDVTRHLRALAGPNSRYALVTSLHRLWLQPLIDTDPDVAYFRTRYCLLTDVQRRWLQDLARVSRFKGTSDPPAWLDADERGALMAFYAEDEEVEQLGPYRFAIGERVVDFGPEANPMPNPLSEA